jgi:hypothetical protein
MRFALSLLLIGLLALGGCGDSSPNELPGPGTDASEGSTPDAKSPDVDSVSDGNVADADASVEAGRDADANVSIEAGHDVDADASSEADAPRDTGGDGPDANCSNPVQHGGACLTEGSTACGYQRSCTDIFYQTIVTCTCNAGRYRCGSCPTCEVFQTAPGCGIGQTCDGLQLHRCDGTMATISATCTCSLLPSALWICENGPTISKCTDAGTGADAQPEGSPDSSPTDGNSEAGDASGG